MNIKDEFLNIISKLNNYSKEKGFLNLKEYALYLFKEEKISYQEKENIFTFVNMRNLISHGGADVVNVSTQNIELLKELELKICGKNKEKVDFEAKRLPSEVIKELFERHNGIMYVKMLKGDDIKFWLVDEGIKNEKLKTLTCTWEQFDVIVEKARELGGIMYRGDLYSQKSIRIGYNGFSVDTIDGFVSTKFFNQKEGDKTTRRSTYYAAVLATANICTNYRSKGKGGYIKLLSEWM